MGHSVSMHSSLIKLLLTWQTTVYFQKATVLFSEAGVIVLDWLTGLDTDFLPDAGVEGGDDDGAAIWILSNFLHGFLLLLAEDGDFSSELSGSSSLLFFLLLDWVKMIVLLLSLLGETYSSSESSEGLYPSGILCFTFSSSKPS